MRQTDYRHYIGGYRHVIHKLFTAFRFGNRKRRKITTDTRKRMLSSSLRSAAGARHRRPTAISDDTRSTGCTGYKKRIRTDCIKKRAESSDTEIISGKHGKPVTHRKNDGGYCFRSQRMLRSTARQTADTERPPIRPNEQNEPEISAPVYTKLSPSDAPGTRLPTRRAAQSG